nr:hypothetical protein [Chitinophagales bacterium]
MLLQIQAASGFNLIEKLQNLAFAFAPKLVGAIIVFLVGDNPIRVYEIFFASAFGTVDGISYTLFYATP